ncbi:MAG: sulfatase-like hydrolase/transferase, partial [Myxococcales bacterium]|nr:sulfatase-like hydrolase/transferase [Myxococcales bacterium]
SSRYGFDRGFDRYTDFGIKDKAENNLSTVDADHVFHNALYFAQQQPAGKPLFLFTHVYDCHYQYDPPAPWNTKFDRGPQWDDEVYRNYHVYQKQMISKVQLDHQVAQYDEEIAYVDAMLEELVETWRASGRELIVVVTADHGEEFGERGSWGHAHTLYPEQLHVPLIVNGPGVKAQRVPERIGTEDIAPTVAALAGIPFPSAKDGHSRLQQVREGTPPTRITSGIFADTSRFDTLVYRWHDAPYDLYVDLNEVKRELYDLSQDPGERRNVYKPNREQAEKMFADMMAWLGAPWTAKANGMVTVVDGVLFDEKGERKNEAMDVSAGARFSVQPGDAHVSFRPRGSTGDVGPWRPLGGPVPGAGCPLAFDGRFLEDAELTERSDDEVAMLEALGYIQGDDDGAGSGEVPSGRVPCR